MALNGNEDALDPIIEAIHDMVDELDASGAGIRREVTLTLVLLALGNAQMGGPLTKSLGLAARHGARHGLARADYAATERRSAGSRYCWNPASSAQGQRVMSSTRRWSTARPNSG
jgi:hypothetical protein